MEETKVISIMKTNWGFRDRIKWNSLPLLNRRNPIYAFHSPVLSFADGALPSSSPSLKVPAPAPTAVPTSAAVFATSQQHAECWNGCGE